MNVSTILIRESFFQAAISFLVYVSSSSRHIFFRRNYLFTVSTSSEQPLFHINFYDSYFFVAAISLEQLLFWEVFFFRNSHFFTVVFFFFQNSYFFKGKLLPSSYLLRIVSSLWQLPFWCGYLFRIKLSTEELLFQKRYFCTVPTFSDQLLFQQMYFYKEVLFQNSYVLE